MAKHILIVEDDPAIRSLLLRIVKLQGYYGIGAESGTEALTVLNSLVFDLITLDLRLQDMSGNDFLAEIAQRNIPTPVVIISATPGEVTPSPQIVGTVTKPFRLDDIISTLRKY